MDCLCQCHKRRCIWSASCVHSEALRSSAPPRAQSEAMISPLPQEQVFLANNRSNSAHIYACVMPLKSKGNDLREELGCSLVPICIFKRGFGICLISCNNLLSVKKYIESYHTQRQMGTLFFLKEKSTNRWSKFCALIPISVKFVHSYLRAEFGP